jgi:hypothetical protein
VGWHIFSRLEFSSDSITNAKFSYPVIFSGRVGIRTYIECQISYLVIFSGRVGSRIILTGPWACFAEFHGMDFVIFSMIFQNYMPGVSAMQISIIGPVQGSLSQIDKN